VTRSASLGEGAIDKSGAIALIVAAISWSLAASLTRKLSLPESKVMSSGAQMLAGGILLTLTAAMLGEFKGFDVRAVSSGAWLGVALLDLRRFDRCLHRLRVAHPPRIANQSWYLRVCQSSRRGSAGYALGGEPLGTRTIVGTLLVLVSVVVITTTPKKKTVTAALVTENGISAAGIVRDRTGLIRGDSRVAIRRHGSRLPECAVKLQRSHGLG